MPMFFCDDVGVGWFKCWGPTIGGNWRSYCNTPVQPSSGLV